jgi:hypothetical protein
MVRVKKETPVLVEAKRAVLENGDKMNELELEEEEDEFEPITMEEMDILEGLFDEPSEH